MSDVALQVPSHVPPEMVRSFNLYDFAGSSTDIYRAWKTVQDETPGGLFYTPELGGYWVLTRSDLLESAWSDADLFSSASGVAIPPAPPTVPPLLPIDSDDPFHSRIRVPLNKALSPRAVQLLSVTARELTVSLIEELKPLGKCDFIQDFSLKMPMEMFMRIVDLPSSDRDHLTELAAVMTKSADVEKRGAAMGEMMGYLNGWILARVENPGTDLMSEIVNLKVDGRELTHLERIGYMANVMFGGLDTVGGSMGLIANHLATHPDDRKRLAANPAEIPDAIDEFLRRYALPTVARTLTRDAEFGGVTMKQGDHVMLSTCLAGLDDKRWSEPLTMDVARCPRDHLTFGKGTHRCPGAGLARAEISVFIEEWLARIPEFGIAPGAAVHYASGGVIGIVSLPLVW